MRKLLLFILLIVLSSQSMALVLWSDILIQAELGGGACIVIENDTIVQDVLLTEVIQLNIGIRVSDCLLIAKESKEFVLSYLSSEHLINFQNCQVYNMDGGSANFAIDSCELALVALAISAKGLFFNQTIFAKGLVLFGYSEEYVEFTNCEINYPHSDNDSKDLSGAHSLFQYRMNWECDDEIVDVYRTINIEAVYLIFTNTTVSSDTAFRFSVEGSVNEFECINSTFSMPFECNGLKVEDKWIMVNSHMDDLFAINGAIFPEQSENVVIHWNQLKEKCLSVFKQDNKGLKNIAYYNGKHPEGLVDFVAYEDLISSYKRLYNIYRARGDIESANACFKEMYEVQTLRLREIQKTNPSFEVYYRIKINQFLGVFTDYSTNPAKAVIVSSYIILFFTFLYLMFPSDWDVTSKRMLFEELKTMLINDERSKMYKISGTTYHLLITILNAFTLSINAFTTLGFGNIPTKGYARYICILQGFLGWFCLSIFSVALINQVLL